MLNYRRVDHWNHFSWFRTSSPAMTSSFQLVAAAPLPGEPERLRASNDAMDAVRGPWMPMALQETLLKWIEMGICMGKS